MAKKDLSNDVFEKFSSKTTNELLKIWDERIERQCSKGEINVLKDIFRGRNVNLNEPREKIYSEQENVKQGGFWSFDKMIISERLIKSIYFPVLVGITASGIVLIINGVNAGEMLIFSGIRKIIIGNVLWRVICEGIIIVLKILEKLNQIEKNCNKMR